MILGSREIQSIPTLKIGPKNTEPVSTHVLKCERCWISRETFTPAATKSTLVLNCRAWFPLSLRDTIRFSDHLFSPMCEIILFHFQCCVSCFWAFP